MLTDPRAIHRHLIRMENEQYYARHTGDPHHKLRWLNVYVPVLRIRLQRAEGKEIVAA
jgi:hypothetical protein